MLLFGYVGEGGLSGGSCRGGGNVLFKNVGKRWLSWWFALRCGPSWRSLGGGKFIRKAIVTCQYGRSIISVSVSMFSSGERKRPTFTGAVILWCWYV